MPIFGEYEQRKRNTKKGPSTKEILGRQLPGTGRSGYVNAASDKLAADATRKAAPKPPTETTLGQAPGQTREPIDFASVEDRAIRAAEQTRVPLQSQIEGPNYATPAQEAQLLGERQKPVFGAFDSQGNKIDFKPNQRNQAAEGFAGTTTGDSSGTGVNTYSPPDVFGQLAKMRELRTNTEKSSGIAFAPNSYTRERNARLNDPRRQAINDIERQARLGNISVKNAYRTIESLIGQQTQSDIAAQRDATARYGTDVDAELGRQKIFSAEGIAQNKLQSDAYQSALDRINEQQIEGVKADREAAKLGLDTQKAIETRRSNLSREALDQAKLGQQATFETAKLLQAGQIAAAKGGQDFAEFQRKVATDYGQGAITESAVRGLVEQYPALGPMFFPEEYTTE